MQPKVSPSFAGASERFRPTGFARWAPLSVKWLLVLCVSAIALGTNAMVAAQPRTAKVAGSFYPEDRTELLDLIQTLLKRQPEPIATRKPRILIVPHAGYQYSGLIAASGFRQLQGYTYHGVVVVGFTHQQQFPGSSVDNRASYETPLGELPIDQEAAAVLQSFPGIGHVEAAHESQEHSVEVELPFLQVVLEHPRIVPILMGNVEFEDAQRFYVRACNRGQLVRHIEAEREIWREGHESDVIKRRVIGLQAERDFGRLRIVG